MAEYLSKTQFEEVIITDDTKYSPDTFEKSRDILKKLCRDGKVDNSFEDQSWYCYNGVEHFSINFDLNERLYSAHIGKEFSISRKSMINMLKCFAIFLFGDLVFSTIAAVKIRGIKNFLESYGEKGVLYNSDQIYAIEQFLAFINTPGDQTERIVATLPRDKKKSPASRKLAPMVNYVVIDEEVSRMFENGEIDDSLFARYFPVYFWVKVTFVIPLRPTEMVLTPFDCLKKDDRGVYLTLRRTQLKKGRKTVFYDVEKDYKMFKYPVPDNKTVKNIEKYISLTGAHKRKYLFDYDETIVSNNKMSKDSFHKLLDDFVEDRLNGNPDYMASLHASGILMFGDMNPGDSRHLALINLILSGTLPQICKALANHENIHTTEGYYGNISSYLESSAFQRMMKKLGSYRLNYEENHNRALVKKGYRQSFCISPRHSVDPSDVSDCREQNHREECMGCKYYVVSETELKAYLEKEKSDLEKRFRSFLFAVLDDKRRNDIDKDKLFNDLQTSIARFGIGCDIKSERRLENGEE